MNKVNVPLALMSLLISVLLWLNIFNTRSVKSRTQVFAVRITTVSLDDTKFLVSDSPENVSVTVAGSTSQIRTVMGQEVSGYVDLSQAQPGTSSYPVVVYPPNVRDLLVNPTVTARIKVEPVLVKEVPITVNRTGRLAARSADVEAVDTFPRTIFIAGSADAIQKTTSVAVNVDLSDDVTSTAGAELEAKPVDQSGKPVQKVMISATGKDVHYQEASLVTPFLVRVRVKMKAPEVTGP
jgi:YbbR domain-containing protein